MDSKSDPKKSDPKSGDDEPKGPPPPHPPPVGAVASPMDTFRKMIRTKHA